MTGCNCHLVNNGTDVQFLCHLHIVKIFHHCHCLSHTQTFSCETSQNVGFSIACKCDECLSIAYALFFEQTKIAPVAMNHHRVAIAKQFVKFLASLSIFLDNFDVHIVWSCKGSTD